jgi:hypothetical protein
MAGKQITARANRSFSTINEGDVITIGEEDARLQAYLASGYLSEVTGDEAKGAKKVDTLDDADPVTVWDGTPGNRRGANVQEAEATEERPAKVAKSTAAKESHGTG